MKESHYGPLKTVPIGKPVFMFQQYHQPMLVVVEEETQRVIRYREQYEPMTDKPSHPDLRSVDKTSDLMFFRSLEDAEDYKNPKIAIPPYQGDFDFKAFALEIAFMVTVVLTAAICLAIGVS